jgi:ATP-binding cassette subfamily F protein 3
MNDLLKEEKELNVKLAKTSITPQDSALLHSRLKVVYQDLHDMEADKAEARYDCDSKFRASAILHGLGFSPEQQNAATRTFSGGWRMVTIKTYIVASRIGSCSFL